MIYFSSDTHFGHKNIAGRNTSVWAAGYRTFPTVEEMDERLLFCINNVVKRDDTLFFLGDFMFKSKNTIEYYKDRIDCQNIHFIIGNHDRRNKIEAAGFISVQDILRITLEGKEFFLSHYPHRSWPNIGRGAIHLYGHEHDKFDKDTAWGKSMDVGVDSAYRIKGSYSPFSIDEIIEIMNNRPLKTETTKML